jgi:hypothetical protein
VHLTISLNRNGLAPQSLGAAREGKRFACEFSMWYPQFWAAKPAKVTECDWVVFIGRSMGNFSLSGPLDSVRQAQEHCEL